MIKFGTDGWRAVISEEFTFENVRRVAQAIADYFNSRLQAPNSKQPRLVVGYDTRFLSDKYAEVLSEVLVANRIKVYLIKIPSPTPMLCFVIKKKRLNGGIIITASHNSYQYNGIKLKMDYGGPAEIGVTREIEALIGKHQIKREDLSRALQDRLCNLTNPSQPYINFVRSYLDMKTLKQKRFNILVDVMYGTANNFISQILNDTKSKVRILHNYCDPFFGGINPEPIPQNMKEIIKLMKTQNYDLGIVNDGDADRVACVGPDGEVINPGQVLSLITLHFIRGRKWRGALVKTISSTSLLEKIAQKYKLKLYETPVGFKHIARLMRKKEILAGGEESGGIGVKDYLPERDGMLTGLLILEMMAYQKKTIVQIMKDLQEEFGRFFYARDDLAYPEKLKKKLFAYLKNHPFKELLKKKIVQIKTYDGIKFICCDDSWLLFRLSGTEPILRIYAEASSRKKADALLKFGKEFAFNL